MIFVKFKKKHDAVVAPRYLTSGAAGCDVCADETVMIEPGERALVSTGLFLEVPDGFECQVRPRSGLALKNGVTVLNSPGTVDSDYRGELKVLLHNASKERFLVPLGARIAQLVFSPVVQARFSESSELAETSRDVGGFGSTGGMT